MQFRFSLIENAASTTTIVDDPINWDGIMFKLERDPTYHGFFDGMDADGGTMRFAGTGQRILNNAYEDYGNNADVDVFIEIECNGTWTEIFIGQLDFQTYAPECGIEGCYVEILAMRKSCVATFNNRLDQKVDLTKLVSFDEVTVLPAYDWLNYNMRLDAKILNFGFTAGSTGFDTVYCDSSGFVDPDCDELAPYVPVIGSDYQHFWQFYLDTVSQGSLQGVSNADYDMHGEAIASTWYGENPGMYTYEAFSNLFCTNTVDINFVCEGGYYDDSTEARLIDVQAQIVKVAAGTSTAIPLAGTTIYSNPSINVPFSEPFTFILSAAGIELNPGDKIFCQFVITHYEYLTGTPGDPVPFPTQIRWDIIDYDVSITSFSQCLASTADVCLINETLSRITEAVTDDCMRVYSDYFGRTDAQPYPSDVDGCGSLETLTNGLLIRQALLKDGSTPHLTVSFKDIIAGLNGIHNIGMGVEDDPNRPGFELIRVEDYAYFYQFGSIIFNADAPNTIKTKVLPERNVSTFKAGYNKWEVEQYGGQEDFHGLREYRTPLKTISNTLDRTSNLIASGYAIEVTRREIGTDNQDFRFDNDTFIICVERDPDFGYNVELDNIASPVNIFSPETVYNFKITPLRNAMRWANYIAQTLIPSIASILKFTTGQGNIVAAGLQTNDCVIENAAMAENADINLADFADEDEGTPFLYNIVDEFDYPLSFTEYLAIQANPYGLVEYDCNGTNYIGFIKKLSYQPADAKATFTLIRAYDPATPYY